jgi:hypothetical protein
VWVLGRTPHPCTQPARRTGAQPGRRVRVEAGRQAGGRMVSRDEHWLAASLQLLLRHAQLPLHTRTQLAHRILWSDAHDERVGEGEGALRLEAQGRGAW